MLETSLEAIGGGTLVCTPPPVSAVYMEILLGAQPPFSGCVDFISSPFGLPLRGAKNTRGRSTPKADSKAFTGS